MTKFIFKKYSDEEIVQFIKLLSKNNYKITVHSDIYGHMHLEVEIKDSSRLTSNTDKHTDNKDIEGCITTLKGSNSSRMCWFCKYTGGTILTSNPPKMQCGISKEYKNTYDTCNLSDETIINKTGCNPDEFRKDTSDMHTVRVDCLL